ncbi:inorganic diphosphatase [Rickettsiales endosymbiont of Peranema trichophorum]|uniref:inorganic diphosphatase n=1 Tax=Rickettsiales endosymbiont of Peranema trichophorum TaxID=2486577 RepID=UPI0010236830|nr:inorganic diphosphatase [Rickettsiales endosymbiont of Peranema trichophorum]RZI45255.1 inorganic diphosphatase [Rickettsiales endosymbiont of Peranema trichophorum]
MNLEKFDLGRNPPDDINVVIEISMNSDPIKYELDKASGMFVVDRFIATNMRYPCNYGLLPKTLSGDGDPLDVLVITNFPVMVGAVINVRPVGVLVTEDEKGQDEKILAVPSSGVDQTFAKIVSYQDLPTVTVSQIEHFFTHYKALESGKWVKIKCWEGMDTAKKIILESIVRFHDNNKK